MEEKFNYTYVKLILIGLISGFINGLLGSGGGIIIVLALTYFLKKDTVSKYKIAEVDIPKVSFATAVMSILPMSIISAIFYYSKGNLSLESSGQFLIPGIFGGVFGGLIMDKINPKYLKLIFTILMIWAGFRIILK